MSKITRLGPGENNIKAATLPVGFLNNSTLTLKATSANMTSSTRMSATLS